MKRILSLLLIAGLTACGPSEFKQEIMPTAGRVGRRSRRLKELRRQCKTERANDGRCCANRGRSNEQALLRRRQGALHAIGDAAEVLTVGGLPHILIFFLRHAAMRFACGVFIGFVPA